MPEGVRESCAVPNCIKKILRENVSPDARVSTDEARLHRNIAKQFAEHMSVNHSQDEYIRATPAQTRLKASSGVSSAV